WVVHLAVLGMAVAPQEQLLEDEEGEYAAEKSHRGLVRFAMLEGVRNDFEERGAQERADCIGNEHRHPRRAHEQRDRSHGCGESPAGYARKHYPAEGHEGGGFYATRSRWPRP